VPKIILLLQFDRITSSIVNCAIYCIIASKFNIHFNWECSMQEYASAGILKCFVISSKTATSYLTFFSTGFTEGSYCYSSTCYIWWCNWWSFIYSWPVLIIHFWIWNVLEATKRSWTETIRGGNVKKSWASY